MKPRRPLPELLADAHLSSVEGHFCRHTRVGITDLRGSATGGRWGPPGAFSVLYLGRPVDSVVIEAYRHLVDDTEGMTGDLVGPRRLLVCSVNVQKVLDLRRRENQSLLGIDLDWLRGDWEPCQEVGHAAYRMGFHGVIAPAATKAGETLALFEQHLSPEECPALERTEIWAALPPDPRVLRHVSRRSEG